MKLMVFGIDGGAWEVASPLIAQGEAIFPSCIRLSDTSPEQGVELPSQVAGLAAVVLGACGLITVALSRPLVNIAIGGRL